MSLQYSWSITRYSNRATRISVRHISDYKDVNELNTLTKESVSIKFCINVQRQSIIEPLYKYGPRFVRRVNNFRAEGRISLREMPACLFSYLRPKTSKQYWGGNFLSTPRRKSIPNRICHVSRRAGRMLMVGFRAGNLKQIESYSIWSFLLQICEQCLTSCFQIC